LSRVQEQLVQGMVQEMVQEVPFAVLFRQLKDPPLRLLHILLPLYIYIEKERDR
jgi:hypothetical protein